MEEKISIPDGTTVTISKDIITVKGKYGSVSRKIDMYHLSVIKTDNQIVLKTKNNKKKDKAILYTYVSHINNMIRGVNNKIFYKLKLVYSHFPVSLEVKGNELFVKNFLGEKSPRKAKILENVNVKISGKEILVDGVDIEKVSQTAANMELATKISKKDRRVFQDGIYIIEKDGNPITK